MVWIIYAMLAAGLLVLVLGILMFARRMRAPEDEKKYDAFEISGGRLTVLAGVPVSYEISEISRVNFSLSKVPRSMSSYNGVLRVVLTNGQRSRPFLFNSSARTKRMVLASSKEEIELTIQTLMEELKQHHIHCSRVA